jgi:hypothetical protein
MGILRHWRPAVEISLISLVLAAALLVPSCEFRPHRHQELIHVR